MPERLRFEDGDDNSVVEAVKRGYSAADSLNRAAESSAKRQQKRAVKKEYAARSYESLRHEAESAAKTAEKTSKAASTAALSKLSPSFRAVMGFVRSGVR